MKRKIVEYKPNHYKYVLDPTSNEIALIIAASFLVGLALCLMLSI